MDRLEPCEVLGALARCSHNRRARFPGPSRFPVPHSIVGIVLLPLAVFVTVFLAVVAALVAFVFFSPVLVLWLVVYLVVIFGLARALPSDRSARLAGTLAAP